MSSGANTGGPGVINNLPKKGALHPREAPEREGLEQNNHYSAGAAPRGAPRPDFEAFREPTPARLRNIFASVSADVSAPALSFVVVGPLGEVFLAAPRLVGERALLEGHWWTASRLSSHL